MLRDAGFDITQQKPLFTDPPHPQSNGLSPRELAMDLARQKALSLRPTMADHDLVLAADTLCVTADGRLIGTPIDLEQAHRMLHDLAGAAHQVVTGVALLGRLDLAPHLLADAATVMLGALSDSQIDDYLATDHWQGKAGGYNLTERVEAGWPLTVIGDPTTVVGLPMQALLPILCERGCIPAS